MCSIKKILIVCVGTALVLGLIFFIWIRPKLEREFIINQAIPKDANTIAELIKISEPYIEKYAKGASFHIGDILMKLNLNQEGQVYITYVSEPGKGIPDVFTVRFDTKMNQINEIYKPFREARNDPGNLNFNEWIVMEGEAYQIALEAFNQSEGRFNFDNYKILTVGVGKPSWWVIFYNDEEVHRIRIDAISGQIISQEG